MCYHPAFLEHLLPALWIPCQQNREERALLSCKRSSLCRAVRCCLSRPLCLLLQLDHRAKQGSKQSKHTVPNRHVATNHHCQLIWGFTKCVQSQKAFTWQKDTQRSRFTEMGNKWGLPQGPGKAGGTENNYSRSQGCLGELLECSGMRLQWWCATEDLLKTIELFTLFLEKDSQSAVISQ